MRATIDVQDVTCDRGGLGQIHHGVRDVLDRRRPAHRRQTFHHFLGGVPLKGVYTTPGATAFTRIPCSAYSIARCWVSVARPPLVIIGTAAVIPRIGLRAREAVIVTTLPPVFCASMCLRVSWVR